MINTSRNLRRAGAVVLSLALAMGTLTVTPAAAKTTVRISKKKIKVEVGKSKELTIKGVKKKDVKKFTVRSKNKKIASAKKKGKLALQITGKKKGRAKVTANLRLKRKVGGKKKYSFKVKVSVTKDSSATPTPVPTSAPTAIPTAAPVATPVVSGTSITIYRNGAPTQEFDVATGHSIELEAKLLPEGANEPVTWTSADEDTATVAASGTATTFATVTAGTEIGKTAVTAKIGAASASVVVNVVKDKVVANIVNVEQTKAKEIKVTFDKDTGKDNVGFNKDKITVNQIENGKVVDTLHVNSFPETSGDGTVVRMALDKLLTDQKEYEVVYSNSTSKGPFKASVGAVKTANITVVEAQQKVPTPITFRLNDANGMDVTEAYDTDRTVTLTIEGKDVTTDNLGTPSKATMTMNTLKETATVKLTYVPIGGDATKDKVEATGNVTCVPTQPTKGEQHFKDAAGSYKKWGDSDEVCAKFYEGTDDTGLTMYTDSENNDIFFYASDAKGKAISYDEYSVETTDNDIASATCSVSEGKFARFTVTTGGKTGAPNLKVKATKYGVSTTYLLPITVIKKKVFSSLTLSATRPTISNTYDVEYMGTITAEAKDGDGNVLEIEAKNTVYEVTNMPKEGEEIQSWKISGETINFAQMTGMEGVASDKLGFKLTATGADCGVYTAYGAKAQQYKIKGTVEIDGIVKTATTSVTVKDIGHDAVDRFGKGVDVKYNPVVDDEVSYSDTGDSTDARLEAYHGNTFLGYVDNEGRIGSKVKFKSDFASTGNLAIWAEDPGNVITKDTKLVVQSYDVSSDPTSGRAKVVIEDEDQEGEIVGATTLIAAYPGPELDHDVQVWVKIEEATVETKDKANTAVLKYISDGDSSRYQLTLTGGWDEEASGPDRFSVYQVRDSLAALTIPENVPEDKQSEAEDVVRQLQNSDFEARGTAGKNKSGEEVAFSGGSDICFEPGTITAEPIWDWTAEVPTVTEICVVEASPVMDDEGNPVDLSTVEGQTWAEEKIREQLYGVLVSDLSVFVDGDLYTAGTTFGPEDYEWDTINPNAASTIRNVTCGVKVGSKYTSEGGKLYNRKVNALEKDAWEPMKEHKDGDKTVCDRIYEIFANSAAKDRYLIANEANRDEFFATPGKYTMTFRYEKCNPKKNYKWEVTRSTKDFDVANSFWIPTVTAESRTVDSATPDDIIACLTANCDLNCNDGENASITAVCGKYSMDAEGKGHFDDITTMGSSVSIRYVGVVEDGLLIYIPKSESFTIAS